ncbi:YcxB family protein [Kitasatospora sp. NPDC018619]|uniref:YcxB family protein n=1 Tax=unclassified Kitasatospora TaxID=2633591 RepID=UPI00379BCC06
MEQGRMELAYTPTGGDFREALAAQARHTAVGRVARVVWWLPAAVSLLGGALKLADGEAGAPDAVLAVVLVALAVYAPRLRAASAHRRVARRGGPRTVLVDGAGVTVTDRCGTQSRAWATLSGFVETEHLFVVLNRSGSCLLILAKRGTADPAALRALLARHTTPIGAPAPADPAPEVRA